MRKLVATDPHADFAVWDMQQQPESDGTRRPDVSLLPLLRALTHCLTHDSGRMLRSLADLACELCGADAAGVCMEPEGAPLPSDTIPIVIASGACTSLSGAEVPRPQSACALAMQDGKPKLFHVPVTWLPLPATTQNVAHGITAPWTAGESRGTLWMLKADADHPLGPAEHQILVTLAALAGIAVLNLLHQEEFRHTACVSASDSLTAALSAHVQQPLEQIQASLQRGLGLTDPEARNRALRAVSCDLEDLSGRVGELLRLQRIAA